MLLLMLACAAPPDVDAPPLVPLPVRVVDGEGSYTLDDRTVVRAGDGAEPAAALLVGYLRGPTGLSLPVEAGGPGRRVIALSLDPDLGPEGYTVEVDEDGAELIGGDAAGLGWAVQTLRQLLPPDGMAQTGHTPPWTLPAVRVEDAPRFGWRGLMLDVARHFFTVEEVERQIDLAAAHKLNRLHLHLTDDQGWRIEIRAWPALTEVGGSTEVGGGPGGWYTQEELVEMGAFAAERGVTLVPEVDLPGHAHAALASYAELNASGVAEGLYTGTGVLSTGLWLDGDVTWDFVEDVWAEVAPLAPGAWVHVGADEAIDVDPDDYAAFVVWLQGVVAAQGKTMVGWDEVGEVDLAPGAVAQWWIDDARARAAVLDGAAVVSSPADHAYLDMVQDASATFGQVWAGPIDVRDAYDWEPVPYGVSERNTAGVEAALWTELIADESQMDLMLWPRAAAIAEVGWTGAADRDWGGFRERLAWHGARLEALGVGYHPSTQVEWVVLDETR